MFNKKIAVGIASLALVAGAAAPAALAYPQETAPSFDSGSYSVNQGGDREGVQLDDVKHGCVVNFTLGGHSWKARAKQDDYAWANIKAPMIAGEYILRSVVSDNCTADAGHRNWVNFYVGDAAEVEDSINSWQTAGKNVQIEGQVIYDDGGADINGAVHVKVYAGSKLLANVGTDYSGYFSTEISGAALPGKSGKDVSLKYIIVANKNFYSYVPPLRDYVTKP